MAKQDNAQQMHKTYPRFVPAQRIEHALLILSFTALCVTGLPQKFAGNAVAEWMIQVMGGIELVRTIHHLSAILFILEGIYHFVVVAHKVLVQRVELSLLPGARDIVDAIDVLRHNLGLTKEHPKMPRYNFAEKAEYWAMMWGGIVMALTGFMLWNPIFVSKLLPGEVIPAAKAAHGGEAVLAALAIIVWHFYNAHLKTFNKSMFTGKMTAHQMTEEHGEEMAQIDAGYTRPKPTPGAIQRRERVFLPVALALAVTLIGGLYWFTTFETTAIATLPATTVPAFAPLPTPAPTPSVVAQEIGAVIPHPVEGQEQCHDCHFANGSLPYPADHVDRPNASCQICHRPSTPEEMAVIATQAGRIPHAVEGKETCDLCHGAAGSLAPLPKTHAGRTNATCTMCHQPGAGAAAPVVSVAKPIPHSSTEATYQDCTLCHGLDKLKPFPENHASFTVDTCTACHGLAPVTSTPAASETPAAGGPKAIPHSITEATYQDCTLCHGLDKLKPFPENHASFTVDTCTACHQPAATVGGGTPTAEETPTAGGPKPIPHSITEAPFQECASCHGGPGALLPYPDNHASFTVDSCTSCHVPPTAETVVTVDIPQPVPHSMTKEIYQDCQICHAPDMTLGIPAPAYHAGFLNDTCTACHQPGQG